MSTPLPQPGHRTSEAINNGFTTSSSGVLLDAWGKPVHASPFSNPLRDDGGFLTDKQ